MKTKVVTAIARELSGFIGLLPGKFVYKTCNMCQKTKLLKGVQRQQIISYPGYQQRRDPVGRTLEEFKE